MNEKPTSESAPSPAEKPGAETSSAAKHTSDQEHWLRDCACTGKNIGKFTAPAALLAIAEAGCLSGYDVAERLRQMALGGDAGPDSGGLYRTMRRMERFHLVTSEWDTKGEGPARRLYRLTELGDQCLDRWAKTLSFHRSAISEFLSDYERLRATEPSAGAEDSGDTGEEPSSR